MEIGSSRLGVGQASAEWCGPGNGGSGSAGAGCRGPRGLTWADRQGGEVELLLQRDPCPSSESNLGRI